MKRSVLSGMTLVVGLVSSVHAADIPRPVYKAPVAALEPIYWTGCYLGGNAGYAWGNTSWSDSVLGEFTSHSTDGWMGGGQIGCDYQANRLVFGVQGMLNAARIKGSGTNAFDANLLDSSRTSWIGTLTGRIGITGSPTLFYAKGGAAWVNGKFEECCFVAPPAPVIPPVVIPDGFAKTTRTGWTVGAGIEHIFIQHWSVFLEYNYIRLTDDVDFMGTNGFANFNYNIDQNIHALQVGLNYRF